MAQHERISGSTALFFAIIFILGIIFSIVVDDFIKPADRERHDRCEKLCSEANRTLQAYDPVLSLKVSPKCYCSIYRKIQIGGGINGQS